MRKTRTKGGGQHAISARIDQEKWEWLKNEPNKNRIINQGLWLWKRNKDIYISNMKFRHKDEETGKTYIKFIETKEKAGE